LRFLHLLNRVTLRDVADLVTKYAGHLRERLGPLDEPAIEVDEPARHREGVHLGAVDDVEVPVEAAVVGEIGDRIAQQVDVLVNGRILDDRQLRIDLGRVLRPELDFLLSGNPAARGKGTCNQGGCDESSHSDSCASEGATTSWARPIPPTVAVNP
jgi:hypothetical protein